jgi:hypothetical protein
MGHGVSFEKLLNKNAAHPLFGLPATVHLLKESTSLQKSVKTAFGKKCVTHVFSYFSNERVERIVDAHPCFRRRFDERNSVELRRVLGLDHVDVSRRQVALVAHQHHRDLLGVFDALDLKH